MFFVIFSQLGFSQIYKGSDAEKTVQGADIVRLKEFSKVPVFIHFRDNINLNIDKSLELTKQFISSGNSDLVLKNVQKNKGSEQTYRYVQTIDGYPIEFSAWLVQVDGNRVYALNGEILDKPVANTSFSISEQDALNLALEYFNAEIYMWDDVSEENNLKIFKNDQSATYFPKGEKLIVPDKTVFAGSELRAAYKFNVFSKKPYKRRNIYIDAQTGKVLLDMQLLTNSDEVGTAITQYSGTQQINTEYTGGVYILNDNTRGDGIKTLNCNNGTDYGAATDFSDDNNSWNNVNAQLDEYATDAQFATAATYDYFLNVHSRNSINGAGYQLWSYIHFNLIDYGYGTNVNAFWNGDWMTYGDGDVANGITPLTTIDISAHEITHGLTSNTSNLNYQDESGALNEGFSDIFGAAVEFYAAPAYSDWSLGEDIGTTFRSLEFPKDYNNPNTYQGEFWVTGSEDYGGVHSNCGPIAYWYFLVSQGGSGTNDLGNPYTVVGIGRDKAEQIAFKLQTVYLTSNSNYNDAWFYAMQSAADIYGACSPEVKTVGDAFYAIGVADPYVAEVHAGFDVMLRESCAPPFEVQFLNQSYNGDNFTWNFGDGQTSTENNPIHTYTDFGLFDVQLSVDGGGCGSDVLLEPDFILIDPSIPCLTLMPLSGNTFIQNCSGLIYDVGGPTQNYSDGTDASMTIYSPGASQIVLNILEFDIEAGSDADCNYDYIAFYDGNSTSASMINSTLYCNTNGNPGMISSTGEYITIEFHTDGAANFAGFKIQYDCIGGDNPPTPYFSVNKQYTCDGLVQFADLSLNDPTSWFWEFGDGTTSNLQNPEHVYLQSGLYSVKLTAYNGFGNQFLLKNDYIEVAVPALPIIPNIQACLNSSFEIALELSGVAHWYTSTTDITPVYIGNNWTHPQLSENTTYYVREVFAGQTFNVGETQNTDIVYGGYYGNPISIHYLVFDAFVPFLLESVEVNAQGEGVRSFALRNSSSEIIQQINVNIPDGVSRVQLNLDIPVGQDLQLVGLGSPNLFRTNSADYLTGYPYTVTDVASIKHSSASTGPTSYYYYFYDWEISTYECQSPFATVELVPSECTQSIDEKILNNIYAAPNPSEDNFVIFGLNNLESYSISITDITGKTIDRDFMHNTNSISLKGFSQGVYFVKIESQNGNKVLKLIFV